MHGVGAPFSAIGELSEPSVLLADNIDPETRDFASLFTAIDPIDQQVVTALSVERATGPCVSNDGQKLGNIRKMTASYKTQVENEVARALSRLIRNGDISLVEMRWDLDDESSQGAQLSVVYKNLRVADRSARTFTLTT